LVALPRMSRVARHVGRGKRNRPAIDAEQDCSQKSHLMILAYAILTLIVLALLLRRDLSAIGRQAYRGGLWTIFLIFCLFLLQIGLVVYGSGQSRLQNSLLILSQVALFGLVLINYHLPGTKLFALGLALNIIVMVANGGWMPVTPETHQYVHQNATIELYSRSAGSKNVVLPRAETDLWVLSDVIRIPLPWRRTAVSVGDILLLVGIAQFIFQTTSKGNNGAPNLSW